MATYNRGQPATGQAFRDSRPLILGNFDAADDAITLDHVTFTDADPTKRALHKKITYNQVQGSAPTLTYPQSATYTKSRSIGGDLIQEPYFARNTNLGTNQETPMVPLAWFRFDSAGTVSSSYNIVTPVTKNATGDFTAAFVKQPLTANYIPNVNYRRGASDLFISVITSAASVNITFRNSAGTLTDPSDAYVTIWGI